MMRGAGALLEAGVVGPMRHQLGRTALAIVAIALGIALGLSIYLINRTAADEISLAARSLFGLADLSVVATNEDFDEMLYPRIARMRGVSIASPKLEVRAKLADRGGAITVIGIDAFRYRGLQPAFANLLSGTDALGTTPFNPNAVFLSAAAARELNVGQGDELRLQVGLEVIAFEIAGLLPAEVFHGAVALVDIATAQWVFGRVGRLSSVDLRFASGASAADVRRKLAALASDQIRVETPGEATDDALRLSRSYRANLTALALVALFTGGFFVYSTQALAVLRRRREHAVLHALGVTRHQQLGFVLASSGVLGLCGSVLGVVLGVLLARFGIDVLGSGIGAGYFSGESAQVHVRGAELLAFCALGVSVALVGAVRPALEAARVPTAAALKASDVSSGELRIHPWAIACLLALSIGVLFVPPIAGLPLPGYVSIALLLIATVAATPWLVNRALRLLPRHPAPPYEVALAELSGTARYAALSVSAIVVSFSLMVAMAIMVSSFRGSLDAWTRRILPADVYVRVGGVEQTAHLDERTARMLGELSGVTRIETSRLAKASLDPDRPPIVVSARSFDLGELDDSLWVTEQVNAPVPEGARGVWLSEAAADLFDVRPGEVIDIRFDTEVLRGFVRGLWRDYEHQHGAVVLARDDYVRLTRDRAIDTVWLWLDARVSIADVRERVRESLPSGIAVDVRVPSELREMSLAVFDRTFAITYVLEIVAVVIGLFGIASGIGAQVLARRGEIGALRHLGFTRGQIASMLAIEGAVLGTVGVSVGLASGAIVSFILIYVVNRQSFHWSMDLYAPGALLAVLSLVLVASSALIAVWSGRHAMTDDVVRAVKEDW